VTSQPAVSTTSKAVEHTKETVTTGVTSQPAVSTTSYLPPTTLLAAPTGMPAPSGATPVEHVKETITTTLEPPQTLQGTGLEAPMRSLDFRTENIIVQPEQYEYPTVVKETILPSERIEVQPIIHRDIEQTEIHEVTQPMHERDIAPTHLVFSTLPGERLPDVRLGEMPVMPQPVQPSVVVIETTREQVERPPIIEETIHKVVIEEVQPVLYKEVVRPVVVEQVQPIYEKIVESPIVVTEQRPMQELGIRTIPSDQPGIHQNIESNFSTSGLVGQPIHVEGFGQGQATGSAQHQQGGYFGTGSPTV